MNVASLFQGIAALSWLVFVGFFALMVMSASRNKPIHRGGFYFLITGLVAIILTTISYGVVFIKPQERGVVVSAVSPIGYREKPLDPGLRWIIPFAESVELYPISKQTYTMSIAQREGQIWEMIRLKRAPPMVR
jgi:hypothetical protein